MGFQPRVWHGPARSRHFVSREVCPSAAAPRSRAGAHLCRGSRRLALAPPSIHLSIDPSGRRCRLSSWPLPCRPGPLPTAPPHHQGHLCRTGSVSVTQVKNLDPRGPARHGPYLPLKPLSNFHTPSTPPRRPLSSVNIRPAGSQRRHPSSGRITDS